MIKGEKIQLSTAQASFLDLEYIFPGDVINNLHGVLMFKTDVKYEVVNKAFNKIVVSHDVFSLRIGHEDNEFFLYKDQCMPVKLASLDFTGRAKDYEQWLIDEQNKKIFYSGSRMYEAKIIFNSKGQVGFSFLTHHMIHDAHSIGIVFRLLLGYLFMPDQIKHEKIYSYIEYLVHLEQSINVKTRIRNAYWMSKVQGYSGYSILRLGDNDLSGTAAIYDVNISMQTAVENFCDQHNISIYSLFMGALAIYRGQKSGENSVVIGAPILNRIGARDRSTIGLYANVLPLFTNCDVTHSTLKFLAGIKADLNNLYKQRYSSYEHIKDIYLKTHGEEPNLYEMILSYQKVSMTSKFDHSLYDIIWVRRNRLVNPLLITLIDYEKICKLSIRYEFRYDRITAEEVEKLHVDLLKIVMALISESPETSI